MLCMVNLSKWMSTVNKFTNPSCELYRLFTIDYNLNLKYKHNTIEQRDEDISNLLELIPGVLAVEELFRKFPY